MLYFLRPPPDGNHVPQPNRFSRPREPASMKPPPMNVKNYKQHSNGSMDLA